MSRDNQSSKVILLEFNELCPSLLARFMAKGALPNFTKVHDSADVYLTDAQCDTDYLEPWIQWVTLHTGLPFEQHKVFRLGQAQNLKHESVWDVLSKQGKRSWLCGSMNARWKADDENLIVLPDPWSLDAQASPAELQPFYEFVRANVQEHTNDAHRLSLKDYGRFLTFMIHHGLSAKTTIKVAVALFRQLIRAPDRWKKAIVLDWLQFDVFAQYYRWQSPDFATFFSNSTAHFQHKFWRYMEPERFDLSPSAAEIEQFGGAIEYAYRNHDALIGEVLKLADAETTVILASALSQQPYTEKDSEGGKLFYRPHHIDKLATIFELEGVESISPVMSHQFHVFCKSEELARANFAKLQALRLDGEALFSLRLEGKDVFGGCRVYHRVDEQETIDLGQKRLAFGDVFYLADSLKSGMHHPHGVFWAYRRGRPQRVQERAIPLQNATRLILSECGVSA